MRDDNNLRCFIVLLYYLDMLLKKSCDVKNITLQLDSIEDIG